MAYLSKFSPAMSLKPKNVRIYLNQENQEMLREAAKLAVDLSEQHLLTLLVSAGLRALKDSGYRIHLPFKMAVNAETSLPVLPAGRR